MAVYFINPNNQIDNLSAFLYKTINNLISDYYRKSERKNPSIDEESNDLERLLVVQPSINNEIDRSFELKEIEKILQQLKPEQRELIIWHYLDDLSIPEIAKISGKSKNAIYVSIHRTMNILKKEIKLQNL